MAEAKPTPTATEIDRRIEPNRSIEPERRPKRRGVPRTAHWIPVYTWLESLETNQVVRRKQVTDWFRENPEVRENLSQRTQNSLERYVRKLHIKILASKRNCEKGTDKMTKSGAVKASRNGVMESSPNKYELLGETVRPNGLKLPQDDAAFRRYEFLTQLQKELENLLSKRRCNLVQSSSVKQRFPETAKFSVCDKEYRNMGSMKTGKSLSPIPDNFLWIKQSELNDSIKQKRSKVEFTPASSFCEVVSGKSEAPSTADIVTSQYQETGRAIISGAASGSKLPDIGCAPPS